MPLFCAILIVCLSGCAHQLAKQEKTCPAEHIKGTGTGAGEHEALMQARAEISSQIQLSITAAYKSSNKQTIFENKEFTESKYKSNIRQTTELLNAQDVKLKSSKKTGEKVEVVACMSRKDAAKPYLAMLPRISDSLNLAVQTELAQSHPRGKIEAARAAESLRMRQIMAVHVLQGLGENAELPNNASYDKMVKDYGAFSSKFKLIWKGGGEEVSQILLSKISSRYKVETGTCVQGLKLIPISSEIECASSQYGPQCFYSPALEGRSCEDDLYFTVKGQRVQGTGEKDENDAKRKLFAQIPKAPFWNNWFEELDKYDAN
ncbi:MAG: hypothetical protein FWC26_04205 [Fibromonadales bacterium]|nr:hypothetical protein [Fibromonadales bacterium]